MKTDIDVLSDAIEIFRWGEGDEATGSKQNAKRSQRAGRLKIDRARQENNVRESSVLSKMLRGRDRFKREFAIRVSDGIKRDGFKGPITEGQERVFGICSYLVSRGGRSRGN